MPSVEISFTLSVWWAVAVAAQLAWAFLVVAPLRTVVERRYRRQLRANYGRQRVFRCATLFAAGPFFWTAAAVEALSHWRIHRHNKRLRRASRDTEEGR